MDPLTALSLSGTIIQFVQFATSLFTGARSIHASATGASENSGSIELIYTQLSQFDSNLSQELGDDFLTKTALTASPNESALRGLAAGCQRDCTKLLDVARKLNVKTRSGPGWWKSFQVAFAEVAKSSEIKELKVRIGEYQRTIIVIFCATSSQGIAMLRAQMIGLRQLIQAPQSQKVQQLGEISDNLVLLKEEVNKFQSRHVRNRLSPEDIDEITAKVLDACARTRKFNRECEVLCGLNFEQRPARYENIAKAHQETLSWVFQDAGDSSIAPSGHGQRSKLIRWLEDGDEIFWVTGKPGSGKSTLMKFVANHERTREALKVWAGDKKFMMACHYFWAAGTPLQKSHEGLLRSLLYDILENLPDLIPIVAPHRWSLSEQDTSSPEYVPAPSWSLEELREAIRQLSTRMDFRFRLCIFVDGLDEYSGDHSELCQAIHDLSLSPNIKFCLSSRPWNVFEENFGKDPSTKLYVHELTQQDVHNYAKSELSKHSRWSTINSDPRGAGKLLDEITTRAQGVFLWVFLVTKELRDGMTNHDTITELWKRLDAIPNDLEQFFKQILLSVEPFYHEKMAGTLQVALTARVPLPATMYAFQDLEYDDCHYSKNDPTEEWNEVKVAEFVASFEQRLSSRCKGLLEIHGGYVEVLHRTVTDFLRTGEMRQFISSRTRPLFDPNLTIFQSYISFLRHTHNLRFTDLLEALTYAHCSNDLIHSDEKFLHDLIDEFEWSFQLMAEQRRVNLYQYSVTDHPPYQLFRTYVLRTALDTYAAQKLESDPHYFDDLKPTALSCVVRAADRDQITDAEAAEAWTQRRLNILRCLLTSGHDPNAANYSSPAYRSAWCNFVTQTISNIPDPTKWDKVAQPELFAAAVKSGAVSMLLDFGADPNATLFSSGWMVAWTMFLLAGIRTPALADSANVYIQLLDRMLVHAAFDQKRRRDPTEMTRQEPVNRTPRSPRSMVSSNGHMSKGASSSETMKTVGAGMWNLIYELLFQLCSNIPDKNKSRDYRELHFLAEIIRVFAKHHTAPISMITALTGRIKKGFPASFQGPILNAINDGQKQATIKASNSQKKGSARHPQMPSRDGLNATTSQRTSREASRLQTRTEASRDAKSSDRESSRTAVP